MYAIISCGGKQYKVQEGDRIKVELLDEEVGQTEELSVIGVGTDGGLLLGEKVASAKVEGEILFNGRGKKINIFTYKAKKNVRRKKGHRQSFTEIEIKKITV